MSTDTLIVPVEARRVRWSAVFAGALTAIAVQFALAILGLGIGATVVDPGSPPDGTGMAIGAAVYWLVCALLALFAGGWVAGRLSGGTVRLDAALHGFLTWALASLTMAMLLTTALGALLGGATRVAASGMQSVGKGIAAAVPAVTGMSGSSAGGAHDPGQEPWQRLRGEVEQALSKSGRPELQPEDLRQRTQRAQRPVVDAAAAGGSDPHTDRQLVEVLRVVVTEPQGAGSAADRDVAADLVAERTGMPVDQARQTLASWSDSYQRYAGGSGQVADEAKDKARDVARSTASAVSKAAWWSFAGLVLGALVASFGGAAGPRRHEPALAGRT